MFVCHGNICRSPLAEYLAKCRLASWKVHSTGTHANPGSRSPARIRRIGLGLNVNLDPHRSTLIDEAAVSRADAIIIMDPRNYRDFAERFPAALDKILLLGMFGSHPSLTIPDPVYMEPSAARRSAEQLADAMNGFLRWLELKGSG
jgi:protein-tyrosine phosphatase